MKKLIPFLLVFSCVSAQAQQWTPLSSGTTIQLNDVFFTSADTGYVVGNDSLLLRTTDRGNTWLPANPVPNLAPGDLASIWMFNNGNGFATGVYQGTVAQTTNSGSSWNNNSGANNPCYPDGLFFNSPSDGYLYGQGCFGGAYVSHWSGSSWGQDQLLDFTLLSNFSYVHVTGMAKNPATGTTLAVCNGGKIFSSVTNFQTWDTVPQPDTANFSAIDYAGGSTYFAVATDANFSNVYISTDDGQTFAPDPTFTFTFFYPGFHDVDMLSNGFGVVGGFSQTTGGGFLQIRNTTGWGLQYQDVPQIIRAVFVVDSTLAFAVGDSGSIYRYDNLTSLNEVPAAQTTLQLSPSVIHASELLTINFPAGDRFLLEVIDAQGRRCAAIANCSGQRNFHPAELGLAAGVYTLRAAGNATTATAKLVIWN